MAIQDKTLSAVEHDFYITSVAGLPANTSLTQAKRRYFMNQIVSRPSSIDVEYLEREWLKQRIFDVTGNKPTSEKLSALWIEMATADGYTTARKNWKQAKFEWLAGPH